MNRLAAVAPATLLLALVTAAPALAGTPMGNSHGHQAQNCLFFWKEFGGRLDAATQVVRAQDGYYGPRDPNSNTAYYLDGAGWHTWYYVYHNGQCWVGEEHMRRCADQVPYQWLIRGDAWVAWYEQCIADAPETPDHPTQTGGS